MRRSQWSGAPIFARRARHLPETAIQSWDRREGRTGASSRGNDRTGLDHVGASRCRGALGLSRSGGDNWLSGRDGYSGIRSRSDEAHGAGTQHSGLNHRYSSVLASRSLFVEKLLPFWRSRLSIFADRWRPQPVRSGLLSAGGGSADGGSGFDAAFGARSVDAGAIAGCAAALCPIAECWGLQSLASRWPRLHGFPPFLSSPKDSPRRPPSRKLEPWPG